MIVCPRCGEHIESAVKKATSGHIEDPWMGALAEWLQRNPETATMRNIVTGLGLSPNRSTEIRVGLALAALGFRRRRHRSNGTREYVYVKVGS